MVRCNWVYYLCGQVKMSSHGNTLVQELARWFGYQSFKSDLQKRAVSAVSEGIYCDLIWF